MARVNISLPDDVLADARRHGWNISRMTLEALRAELDRVDKIAALDAYLAELDAELGPPSADEVAAAERWLDDAVNAKPSPRRGDSAR